MPRTNEDAIPQATNINQNMPDARYQALRRIFLDRGVGEDVLDAAIISYLRDLSTISCPSDEELQAMLRKDIT